MTDNTVFVDARALAAPKQGDCFKVAAELVLADAALTLVHGLVTAPDDADGRKGRAEPGQRHAHAWVETQATVKMPDGRVRRTTVVVDVASGRRMAVMKGTYYDAGHIVRPTRYSHAQVRAMLVEHQNWGPWKELS